LVVHLESVVLACKEEWELWGKTLKYELYLEVLSNQVLILSCLRLRSQYRSWMQQKELRGLLRIML
jgi:hypothetical protein